MRCLKPKSIVNPVKGEQMVVRCGKCLPCRDFKAGEWTIRLLEQEKCSKGNYFITLTLDDQHLTWTDKEPTLNKRDVQLFFKRLRKKLPNKIKSYSVGEYGKTTKRPHYHSIIFDTKIKKDDFEWKLLGSWDKGFVHVGDVTPASIRYVAGYLEKDIMGNEKTEEVQREFSLMSKGLGLDYVKNSFYYHRENKKFEYHSGGGRFRPLPRYYRNKIFAKQDAEEYAQTIKVSMGEGFKKPSEEENDLNARINRLKAKQSLNNKRK